MQESRVLLEKMNAGPRPIENGSMTNARASSVVAQILQRMGSMPLSALTARKKKPNMPL